MPVYYYVFDVLWADSRDVRPPPLRDRKRILRGLLTFTGPGVPWHRECLF